MKKTFRLLSIILICAISTLSCSKDDGNTRDDSKKSSQTTYNAEVEKLLEATNSKEVMISFLSNSLKTMFSGSEADQIAKEVINEVWSDYVIDCSKVYQKYFTLQDIIAINEFYQTPSGEKFAKNTQNITNEMYSIGSTQYSDVIHDVIKRHRRNHSYNSYDY